MLILQQELDNMGGSSDTSVSMAQVVLENVTKMFRAPNGAEIGAVRNLNLQIDAGEFLVLLGPSGSGKSTTLRLIAGLESLTRGTISIGGRVVNDLSPKERDVAMVQQEHALFPHLTVYENLALGLKLRKVPRTEIAHRVNEAAALLGLTDLVSRQPAALSGGERRRVALGRAMVRRPQVILFDEPLAHLDPGLRNQLRGHICRLHQESGATIIYVTHDHAEAMALGNRIVVLKDGFAQQQGAPMEVYRQPKNLFVAGFVGTPAMNFVNGTVTANGQNLCFVEQRPAGSIAAGSLRLPVPAEVTPRLSGHVNRTVILGLRPENLAVVSAGKAVDPDAPFRARIEQVEQTGADLLLHLTTDAHGLIARVDGAARLEAGAAVELSTDLTRANFFDPETGLALSN